MAYLVIDCSGGAGRCGYCQNAKKGMIIDHPFFVSACSRGRAVEEPTFEASLVPLFSASNTA